MSLALRAALTGSLLQAASPTGAIEVRLALRPEPGTVVAYTVETHCRIEGTTVSALGFDAHVEQDVTLVVLEVLADGSRRCELRFGRVRGSIENSMIERVEFDSAEDADEGADSMLAAPLVAQFELTAGRTFQAHVDARGRVLWVDGFLDVFRGTPVEFMYAMGGYPLSEALFLDDVQVFFPLLPAAPISAESRWSVQQDAELLGVEMRFDLDCFANRADEQESAWSWASVGAPTTPDRRAAAAAQPAEGLSPLSLDAVAARWIQQGIVVRDGTMSGACRTSSADGTAIELRHAVRSRGTMPHPTAGTRVEVSSLLEFAVRRAGPVAEMARNEDQPAIEPASATATRDVERLFREARALQPGRSSSGAFDGSEIALGDDHASALRCASFRPDATGRGSFVVELNAPAFPAWLVVLDATGTLRRAAAPAGGSASIRFDASDPAAGVLVLVEGSPSARGPFVLSLDTAGAGAVMSTPSTTTPFNGVNVLDATSLFAGTPERREELLGHYRLFAAGAERLGGSPAQQAHMHALHAMACQANGEAAGARLALTAAWERLAAAKTDDPEVRFELLGIEFDLARSEGRIGKARAALDELVAHAGHPSMHPEVAALHLHDHALFLLVDMDDAAAAATYARAGLAVLASHSIQAPRIEAGCGQVLASALAGSDPEAAEEVLRSASAVLVVSGDAGSGIHATIQSQLAGLQRARGELAAARRTIDHALDAIVCATGWEQEIVTYALAERARILDAHGDDAGAWQARQDALAILVAWEGEVHPRVRAARIALAHDLARLGRTDDAWGEVERIVATDRDQAGSRLAALSETERLQYQATQRAALDLAHALPAGEQHAGTAYDTALLAKGAVARSLDAERARLRSRRPEETARILGDLRATQAALSSASLAGTARMERIDELRARRDELERKLTGAVDVERSNEPATDAANVHERLEPGSVLVDFVIHRDAAGAGSALVTAWVTSAGIAGSVRVDLGSAAPIERAVEAWRAVMDAAPARGIAITAGADATTLSERALELRERLWLPIAPAVEGALRVVVCPDGFLAGVPFGALPDGAGGYLVEEIAFLYVHGAATIARAGGAVRSVDELLVVGGVDYGSGSDGQRWSPLPGTRREIAAVAALHRDVHGERSRVRTLEGAEATESRLCEALERARVVHIATHGFAEPARRTAHGDAPPEIHAGLVCARPAAWASGADEGTTDDGLLTADQIAWLDLSRVDLVVLSACSSGLGQAVPGEGMLGLRRAFRRAGAGSVVSALWPVPDEATAELMAGFYERLWRGGLPRAEALRSAQLAALHAARENGEDDSPRAWGAFVLE